MLCKHHYTCLSIWAWHRTYGKVKKQSEQIYRSETKVISSGTRKMQHKYGNTTWTLTKTTEQLQLSLFTSILNHIYSIKTPWKVIKVFIGYITISCARLSLLTVYNLMVYKVVFDNVSFLVRSVVLFGVNRVITEKNHRNAGLLMKTFSHVNANWTYPATFFNALWRFEPTP